MGTKTTGAAMPANAGSRGRAPDPRGPAECASMDAPPQRRLSAIVREFGPNPDLADAIEKAYREMRNLKPRESGPHADS
ncbi:MAG: hypothetical protein QMC96_09190 [Methanomicrobiales archaeon]|nr:hypothetical protein [Methanomicrobiales archaeon]